MKNVACVAFTAREVVWVEMIDSIPSHFAVEVMMYLASSVVMMTFNLANLTKHPDCMMMPSEKDEENNYQEEEAPQNDDEEEADPRVDRSTTEDSSAVATTIQEEIGFSGAPQSPGNEESIMASTRTSMMTNIDHQGQKKQLLNRNSVKNKGVYKRNSVDNRKGKGLIDRNVAFWCTTN